MAKKRTTYRVSAPRQRKIDHINKIKTQEGWTKSKIRQKALHHMKMQPEDLQAALDGLIY